MDFSWLFSVISGLSLIIFLDLNLGQILVCFFVRDISKEYLKKIKILPNNGVLIPNCLNSPLTSCSPVNLEFLLLHTAHFDKSIVLRFLAFMTLCFLLSVSFLHFKYYDEIMLYCDISYFRIQIIINPFIFFNYLIHSDPFVTLFRFLLVKQFFFVSLYFVIVLKEFSRIPLLKRNTGI